MPALIIATMSFRQKDIDSLTAVRNRSASRHGESRTVIDLDQVSHRRILLIASARPEARASHCIRIVRELAASSSPRSPQVSAVFQRIFSYLPFAIPPDRPAIAVANLG